MKKRLLKLCGWLARRCGAKNVLVLEAGNMVICCGKLFKVDRIAVTTSIGGKSSVSIEGIDLVTDKERQCLKVK